MSSGFGLGCSWKWWTLPEVVPKMSEDSMRQMYQEQETPDQETFIM